MHPTLTDMKPSTIPVQPFAAAQQPTPIQAPNSPRRNVRRALRLDKLPLEIIQRIASYTSCKAILALQLVCRVLYHACSDVFIMKHFLERSLVRSPIYAQHPKPAWYDSVLSLESPFLNWARYALAQEEMAEFIKDLEAKRLTRAKMYFSRKIKGLLRIILGHSTSRKVQPRHRRMVSWVPQILALHCQSAFRVD
jgi:hypothetical protein